MKEEYIPLKNAYEHHETTIEPLDKDIRSSESSMTQEEINKEFSEANISHKNIGR